MIDYTYKELFNQDSIDKQIVIAFDGGEITNTDLYAESFELKESLCSDEELRFGSCEASVLKLKIRNEFGELKNKWLDVSMTLDGNTDIPFQIGRYKVYSDEPSGDRKYTNITAYDALYDIINTDVSKWYNSLTFPITQKEFRDSFFEYFGIEQEEVELIQDSMTIEQTISTTSISGKDIITAICELDGVFGHINRQGNFEYISLADKTSEILYPKIELYPSSDLYTTTTPYSTKQHSEIVSSSRYISCEYEDFETCFISKLQIRQEENDIGAVVGDGANTYIVEDNFLVYGKSSDELSEIAERLLEKIKLIQYRPMKAIMKGNPCLEVGDAVVFHTRYKDIEGYVLVRTIKGIQALKDTFEAKGVYEYKEKVNSVQREIKRLKGKTNVLERTVEQTRLEIKDVEKNLQSEITQTADKIEAKVSKGDVSSQLSIELGKILLKGNRVAIESDYFNLSEDGSLIAKNALLSGEIVSDDPNTLYSTRIKDGKISIYGSKDGENINAGNICSFRGGGDADNYDGFSIILGQYSDAMCFGIHNGNANDFDIYYYINNGYDANYLNYGYRHIWYEKEAHFGDMLCSGASFNGSVVVSKDFNVAGTKSRVTKTENYNNRLLYCYEMPSPIFGDIGHGVIGEDGLCYIDIDQIFFETVDMNQSYQVFLQSYSEHNVYVAEKQPQYFVVKGQPTTEFDWEIKAKQLDFPLERLEEQLPEDDYQETDYVALASQYLNEYEQEVLSYE